MPRLNIFRRLLNDDSGVTVIEFAAVAPAFVALLVAILQTALIYLAQGGLESAAEGAGRILMTGQAQQTNMTTAQFKTAVCAHLPPYMSCNSLMIDVATASSFSGADMSPPTLTYNSSGAVTNSFSYSPGTQGAIVIVRLLYLWPVAPGPLGFNLADQPGGKHLLMATSVLKSEIY